MNKLLAWILALLFPGEDDLTGGAVDDTGGIDDIDDLLGDDPAAPAEPTLQELQEQLRSSASDAARLQRELDDLRRASPPRSPPSGAPAQDPEAQVFAQEEQRLATPDITPLERWQIESNRSIRRAAQESRTAREQVSMTIHQLRDTQDKALYDARAASDKIYKRYADKVEQRIAEIRNSGATNIPPREVILKFFVGEDIMSGKMKRKAPAAASAPEEHSPRGHASARSDVPRKPGNTERDKRRARLENVLI